MRLRNLTLLSLAGLVAFAFATPARAGSFSFTRLGDLPGGDIYCVANGVSADGSVVVGNSHSASSGIGEAFRWTSGGGMVSLRDLLVNHGVSNLTGCKLVAATGISADGRTIVGYGTNPDGNTEAWIATVPEPATITLAATGLACACVIAARRRRRQHV